MSEQETFISRWSRRKQEAEKENQVKQPAPEPSPDEPAMSADEAADLCAASPVAQPEHKPVFDPASLPPLDSIAATTDIRAFLSPGVPEELKRAALQRVWRADPAIRDFVGLSENSWDFNDPNSIHGFGPLEVTERIKAAVEAMFDQIPAPSMPDIEGAEPESKPKPEVPPESSQQIAHGESVGAPADQISASAPQGGADAVPVAVQWQPREKREKASDHNARRGHGGALPK